MNNTSQVSTLEAIKARVQERKTREVSTLPTHYHELLGTVYIAHMPQQGYQDIECAEIVDESLHKWPKEEKYKLVENRKSWAYMKWGVLTADGQRLDDEVLKALEKGDYGAENKKLINAIRKINPPREVLTDQFRVILGFSQMSLVLFRILERAGLLEKVRDYILADPGSDEAEMLAADLKKWEETLPVWQAFLEADELAKQFGIETLERLKNEAAAIEQPIAA